MQRCLARVLAFLMAVMPILAGQQDAPAAPPQSPAAPSQTPATAPPPENPPAQPVQAPGPAPLPVIQGLKVLPLAGKDELNDLERKVMAPLVVEVVDQNDRPVEGAEVVFRFPLNGPGALFQSGKTSQTVRTNGQGQAAAMNWMANGQVGRFEVHIAASYGNQVGEVTFSMSNVAKVDQKRAKGEKHGGWFSPTWVKVAVIGGAVAIGVGVFLATRGGGHTSTSTSPTVTISPGSPSVGGPQ
jgi:hypothetical protein